MNKRPPPGIVSASLHFSKHEIVRLLNRVILESPIPLLIQDEDSRILQVSKGWTRFSGYTLEDIPTVGDWKQRAYGTQQPDQTETCGPLADETVDDGEWVITAKDGSKRIWHFM